MGNIEHWIVRSAFGGTWIVDSERRAKRMAEVYPNAWITFKGPFVPASQLEGAVAALEQIVRHSDMPAGESWERAYVEVTSMARDALTNLRGQ